MGRQRAIRSCKSEGKESSNQPEENPDGLNMIKPRRKKRAPRKVHIENDFLPEKGDDPNMRITKSGSQIYSERIHPHAAYALAREHGFTNKQIARVFGVSHKTLQSWVTKYENFAEMIQKGKDEFDTYNVEQMLLKRAMGFEYTEISEKTVQLKGKQDDVMVYVPGLEVTRTTKYIPPDVKAATFWLTNRNKDRWSMVQKIQAEINSTQKTITANTADLANMSVEQLKQLRGIIADVANQSGKPIPIECVGTDTDDETLMLEHIMQEAASIAQEEVEEGELV